MLNYKVRNTPDIPLPRESPVKMQRRAQAGEIQIAPVDQPCDEDDIESIDDPASKRGRKTSHLRQLHQQNKQEA